MKSEPPSLSEYDGMLGGARKNLTDAQKGLDPTANSLSYMELRIGLPWQPYAAKAIARIIALRCFKRSFIPSEPTRLTFRFF